MPHSTPPFLLALVSALGSCAHLEPRCSEYRQVLSQTHGELLAPGSFRIGASTSQAIVVPVSEEGALLSKRLKTLCELRWEGEISQDRYYGEVRQAYEDYLRARTMASDP